MPMGRQIHIDVPLSNLSLAAFETMGDFVAPQLFPVVNVDKQSNKYYVLDQDSWNLIPDSTRGPKTKANRVDFKVSSDSYFAKNYALATDNALEDLDNQDTAINLRETGVNLISRMLMADWENRVATKVRANVGTTLPCSTNGTSWDSVDSADIVGQVRDAKLTIFGATGLTPNTIVIDYKSLQYAMTNTRAKSIFKFATDGMLSMENLKSIWGIDNILVARSLKNTKLESLSVNNPGVGSYASLWGPTCLVTYVPPAGTIGLRTIGYGASFRWTPAGMPGPMQVTRQVEAGAGTRNVEVLEAGYYQDEKVLSSALSYLINTKSGQVW